MKSWRIIILIALALFSVIRLASTCEKQKNTKLKTDFSERVNSIEEARSKIFANQNISDSVQWKINHINIYNTVLDSGIEYYRNIYTADEKRNRQYLKVLYEYKKLYYEYQSLVALNEKKISGEEVKEYEYQKIQERIRAISLDLNSYKLAAMWDIFD